MATPVETRIAAAGRAGAFGIGGLEDFRRFFSSEPMASVHYEWRTLPVTAKVVRALRDLAMSHPAMPRLATSDVAVQYGITVGLSLAADLLDDPALIVPGLFGTKPPEEAASPAETFEEPSEPV